MASISNTRELDTSRPIRKQLLCNDKLEMRAHVSSRSSGGLGLNGGGVTSWLGGISRATPSP